MNSKQPKRLDLAITWAEEARRAALRRVKAAGNPRNPYRAREGREAEFDAGKMDAHGLGLVLDELKLYRARGLINVAAIIAAAFTGAAVGLYGLAGIAFMLDLMGFPSALTTAAWVVCAVTGVAWAVSSIYKARRARK